MIANTDQLLCDSLIGAPLVGKTTDNPPGIICGKIHCACDRAHVNLNPPYQ